MNRIFIEIDQERTNDTTANDIFVVTSEVARVLCPKLNKLK